MAQMSMNKVIHAAFRRDLDRFVDALGRFSPGDAERAARLGRAWANFEEELTQHHTGEHEIAWPALAQVGVTPETIEQMDAEHDVMAAALGRARVAMATLATSPRGAEAAAALSALEELRRVTVVHLDHEEAELEPVYLANVDSPAVKEMGRSFARAQAPPRAGRFLAWLTDGAGPEERAALAANIPKPVLTVLRGLFGRGYRKEIAPVWTV
jgi:hypothetical protein